MSKLAITSLVKQFPNGTVANDGISFVVEPGEIYGLLGPNGAGKTTLVRQVLGLLKPTSGAMRLDGVDIVERPGFARSNIGFLPQSQVSLESIRVGEFIGGVGRLRGLSPAEATRRADDLIERLDLVEFRGTAMRSASGGVRRLAGFAAAAIGGAQLLVLDEPTNDVDPLRRQAFWGVVSQLSREGTAVLLVTHNLAEAERVLHRLAIIDHGRILQEGSPASLRAGISQQLRLELVAVRPVSPHPVLSPDAADPSAFLFDREALVTVSDWLAAQRASGTVVDFRIAPPSLEDIYIATVGAGLGRSVPVAAAS